MCLLVTLFSILFVGSHSGEPGNDWLLILWNRGSTQRDDRVIVKLIEQSLHPIGIEPRRQAIAQDPIVTTGKGQIRGLTHQTPRYNVTFHAFIGIPYARPPVGNLRFQPPQPASNWSGILETKRLNKICFQTDRREPRENEDCLYLSVITPSIDPSKKLPVLVHIHGGTFVDGSSLNAFQPQLLIERGVIVITVNYRLGPFGFLSTGNEIVPGNMGLKDQHLAIKWVHNNIGAFGGDPEKVTLIGQSAGGASVTYQMLNPANQGLFRGVISNSGSTLCTWAYQRHNIESAYAIARMIDSNITRNNSIQEVIHFLQTADAKAIAHTGEIYKVWAPVMELPNAEAFFSQSMYEQLRKGEIIKVPLLIGINSEEGIKDVKDLDSFRKSARQFDLNPQLLVNEDMYISDIETTLKEANKIKKIYTNTTWEQSLGPAVKFFSDDKFTRAIIEHAALQSAHTDVFFYQFSYHGELGQNNISVPGIDHGVAHAEDQRYLWVNYNNKITKSDLLTADRYVTLITNFAKTLHPTPTRSELFQNVIWPKVNENNYLYLNIDNNITVEENPREFSFAKWKEIYEADAKKPLISF